MALPWVRQCLEAAPCVLVTLRQHKGSSPRESGARMVVDANDVSGSIGGGNLEHQAIATAREMLAELDVGQTSPPRIEPYGLGPHLNQCCGGSVELLFEVITLSATEWMQKLSEAIAQGDHAVLATAASGDKQQHHVALPVGHESDLPAKLRTPVREMLDDKSKGSFLAVQTEDCDWWLERISKSRRQVWLFGAGHVGKAVVKALADLPFEVHWLDGREDEFPDEIPGNVTIGHIEDLTSEVSQAPGKAIFIVMTHSHELDEDLCHMIMTRGDFSFLGMIGSKSKGRRFVHRLGKRGIPEEMLARLTCPIGLPNIVGKEPATIALSLAAQLMSQDEE